MNQFLHDYAAARFEQQGWTLSDGAAIAIKLYPTAVGPKQAAAYLADFGAESEHILIQGDYISEGNNVLAASSVFVHKKADAATIHARVDEFIVQANAVVADTYAARLLRNSHPQTGI
ncbi:hypothetical protein [Burkholderia cenocepacia]|uniref:hypothetical protein n=1 Tax=Burkholderia cenocepacia TaxID=95486 RepID=UPI000761F83E|nr:hypothetical protein [Burkholderia cenocepacia]KWU19032.1 hypothetical protein AS149_12350 [Burkholderia cenocepacia]